MQTRRRLIRAILAVTILALVHLIANALARSYLISASHELSIELRDHPKRVTATRVRPGSNAGRRAACNAAELFRRAVEPWRASRHEPDSLHEGSAEAVAALQKAAMCEECDWFDPAGEEVGVADAALLQPFLKALQFLGGGPSAERLDLSEIDRLLDSLRLAACLGNGTLSMRLVAIRAATEAATSLGSVLAPKRRVPGESIGRLSRELELLADSLPSVAGGMRLDGLTTAIALARWHLEHADSGRANGLLPSHVGAALTFRRDLSLIRATAEAVAIADVATYEAARVALEVRIVSEGSARLREILASWQASRRAEDYFVARYRLLQLALRAEKLRSELGHYPDASSLGIHLVDPFAAPNYLKYERQGLGYRAWSAGPGRGSEIVVEGE